MIVVRENGFLPHAVLQKIDDAQRVGIAIRIVVNRHGAYRLGKGKQDKRKSDQKKLVFDIKRRHDILSPFAVLSSISNIVSRKKTFARKEGWKKEPECYRLDTRKNLKGDTE